MNKRQKRKVAKFVWALILLLIACIGTYFAKDQFVKKTADPVSGDEVQFHFIDVGQGDAALIRTAAGDVLIDAGPGSSEDALIAYLDAQGVDNLAYAVFTHPDEDHIGGADVVLENYDVACVIRPDHDVETKVFERMITLIEAEGAEEIFPDPGYTFRVGEVNFTVLAPIGEKYSSRNDYSVVLRVDYGETSVLFTGDAETKSEGEMLDRYRLTGELDCDLIKVGHHGSDSSSSQEFLNAVTPDFAVISCGEGNKYGHPLPEILTRYEGMDVPVYRTDLEGSIVFTSDGGEPERLAA